MCKMDFVTPVRREVTRIAPVIGLSELPELCAMHYWLEVLAYRTSTTILTFNCELDRGFGMDVRFGTIASTEAGYSVHTYLRLFDPSAAQQLGFSIPQNQADMDELLRLYVDALLTHRKALFEQTEATIASMEREFIARDFANQRFYPKGRFC
jgi:hypothetical protein